MSEILSINGLGTPRILTQTDVVLTDSNTIFGTDSVGPFADLSSTPTVVTGVLAGMRASSFAVVAGQPNKPVYGKVVSTNPVNFLIYVDAWVPVAPTNGQPVSIDGWVIDLPICQQMTETFEPDQNVHNLFRNRLVSKFFGWKYSCSLDYSQYILPDTLVDIRYALGKDTNKAMVLIPHVDKPEFQYNVIFDQPISHARFGIERGYKLVVFTFKGKETIAMYPIAATGYGFGYATNYGVQY